MFQALLSVNYAKFLSRVHVQFLLDEIKGTLPIGVVFVFLGEGLVGRGEGRDPWSPGGNSNPRFLKEQNGLKAVY